MNELLYNFIEIILFDAFKKKFRIHIPTFVAYVLFEDFKYSQKSPPRVRPRIRSSSAVSPSQFPILNGLFAFLLLWFLHNWYLFRNESTTRKWPCIILEFPANEWRFQIIWPGYYLRSNFFWKDLLLPIKCAYHISARNGMTPTLQFATTQYKECISNRGSNESVQP